MACSHSPPATLRSIFSNRLRAAVVLAPLDSVIPSWAAVRAEAAAIGPSDWLAQHAYALRLVALIQKANPA
jgi:hypothetical protein